MITPGNSCAQNLAAAKLSVALWDSIEMTEVNLSSGLFFTFLLWLAFLVSEVIFNYNVFLIWDRKCSAKLDFSPSLVDIVKYCAGPNVPTKTSWSKV